MIDINLLPSVKREYLKSQQMKRTVVLGSGLLSVTAIVILGLLWSYVNVVQPQHQKNLEKDIQSGVAELKSKDNAVKIVTVQGALEQLPGLQDKKLITSNLFTYVTNFTPQSVSYSDIKYDATANTLTLQGATNTVEQANVLANNLKGATFTYKQGDTTQTSKPFTSVVFEGLSKSEESQDGKSVAFSITLTVDPVIFSQAIQQGAVTVNASSEALMLQTDKPFNEATP